MRYGLSHYEIYNLIMESVDKNPNLKYYINNDYIYELVEALVDGISIAIEENTQAVMREIKRDLEGRR